MKRKILIRADLVVAGVLSASSALFALDTTPPASQPASDLSALTRQLGDDDFHVREAASEKLQKMGKAAIPALEEARRSSDPEVHARADALLQELEHPAAVPVPQPTGFGNSSVSVSVINGIKTIDAHEPGRTTHIDDNADGISMKVTGQIDGKEVTREYKAKTAEQLKKDNPEAFGLYQQYNGNDDSNGGMRFQVRAGAGIQGNLNIQGGAGGIAIGPNNNPQLLPPPIPARPAINPTRDDLDKLEAKINGDMKTANTSDAHQEEVKGLLKELRQSLPQAGNINGDRTAQMREYNRRSDALRKELAELKLPDPGDALPPPSWARLGISATEEDIPGQGLTITNVLPDSRAEKIGLKEFDVIQKVNGQDIHSTRDLRKLVTENPKGLIIEGVRDGKAVKLEEPAVAADEKK